MIKYSALCQRNFIGTTLRALVYFTLFRSCCTRNSFSDIDLSTQTLNPSVTEFMITGNAASDYFGRSVSTAGDIDNDGYDDTIVGAYQKNSVQGAVYAIYGAEESSFFDLDLSTTTLDPLTTGFMITGDAANDHIGFLVSTVGDINNDGSGDIIIGAYGENSYQGAAYVIYGGAKASMSNIVLGSTTLDPLTTGFMITGNAVGDCFGVSAAKPGISIKTDMMTSLLEPEERVVIEEQSL